MMAHIQHIISITYQKIGDLYCLIHFFGFSNGVSRKLVSYCAWRQKVKTESFVKAFFISQLLVEWKHTIISYRCNIVFEKVISKVIFAWSLIVINNWVLRRFSFSLHCIDFIYFWFCTWPRMWNLKQSS